MNIEDMTIKQFRELSELFSQNNNQSNITKSAIGKYVIIRSRNEGVNCGKLIEADQSGCILEDARRLYYHKPKDNSLSWYEGVAHAGVSNDTKMSGATSEKYIIEEYSITVCSETAEQSLRGHVAQSS